MASFRKSIVAKSTKISYTNSGLNNGETTTTSTTMTQSAATAVYKGSKSGQVIPNRVFVGGIDPTATVDELTSLFNKYGNVTNCRIVNNQNGSSKGYGFVTFEKADDVPRLYNDAQNLVFKERKLNIGPAVQKPYPQQYVTRYQEPYVVPLTPSGLYFPNNIQYQFPEPTTVYPNNGYAPQLAVVPAAVSDTATYYPNNYGIPTTPYQGAALYYPVSPTNASPLMVGPSSYSSYQPLPGSNSSSYVYSSVYSSSAPATTSPSNSSSASKGSSTSINTPSANSIEMAVQQQQQHHHQHHHHGGSHNGAGGGGPPPIMTTMPPSMSTLPPPMPFPLSTPHPQYYSSANIIPHYTGDVYYSMVPGPAAACYPMMTINGGQESYISYYEEPCAGGNVVTEESNAESQHHYVASMTALPPFPSTTTEMNCVVAGRNTSPSLSSSSGHNSNISSLSNSQPVATNNIHSQNGNATLEMKPALVPTSAPPPLMSEQYQAVNEPSYAVPTTAVSAENGAVQPAAAIIAQQTQNLPPPSLNSIQNAPQPPPVATNGGEYSQVAQYMPHRNPTTTVIYPNGGHALTQQPNMYFNSVYMTETNVALGSYPKNLSEQYVSDHLPKRETKYATQRSYNGVPPPSQQPQLALPQPKQQQPLAARQNGRDVTHNITTIPQYLAMTYPDFGNRNPPKSKEFKEYKDYKMGAGDYKNVSGKNGDERSTPRQSRMNNGSAQYGNAGVFAGHPPPPKHRIYENSQYRGNAPFQSRGDRNGQFASGGPQYPRPGGPNRQNSHEQMQTSIFEYHGGNYGQNHHTSYGKNRFAYEPHNHRRYGQNSNNGGNYRGKFDRSNNNNNNNNNNHSSEEQQYRHKKYTGGQQSIEEMAVNTNNNKLTNTTNDNNNNNQTSKPCEPAKECDKGQYDEQQQKNEEIGKQDQQLSSQKQSQKRTITTPPPTGNNQQTVCAEMQKLAL